MVKTLEVKISGLINLRGLKEGSKYNLKLYEGKSIGYSCDCDTFGGGDPPCDCNR